MKFKNYINTHTGDRRIYSLNDITQMSLGDVLKNKEELLSQYRVLGVPTESELLNSDNVVYVSAYTRDDGTEVHAHWRSKPDGIENNNLSFNTPAPSGIQTGGAADVKQSTMQAQEKRGNVVQTMINDYKGIQDPIPTALYALGAFLSNYMNMKNANTIGADKYFHARANYEAAQQGLVGSTVAKIISDLRELTDSYRNIYEKGYSKDFSNRDSEEDQQANEEGRNLGRKYPNAPAGEKLRHRIPKGLPERYKKY